MSLSNPAQRVSGPRLVEVAAPGVHLDQRLHPPLAHTPDLAATEAGYEERIQPTLSSIRANATGQLNISSVSLNRVATLLTTAQAPPLSVRWLKEVPPV